MNANEFFKEQEFVKTVCLANDISSGTNKHLTHYVCKDGINPNMISIDFIEFIDLRFYVWMRKQIITKNNEEMFKFKTKIKPASIYIFAFKLNFLYKRWQSIGNNIGTYHNNSFESSGFLNSVFDFGNTLIILINPLLSGIMRLVEHSVDQTEGEAAPSVLFLSLTRLTPLLLSLTPLPPLLRRVILLSSGVCQPSLGESSNPSSLSLSGPSWCRQIVESDTTEVAYAGLPASGAGAVPCHPRPGCRDPQSKAPAPGPALSRVVKEEMRSPLRPAHQHLLRINPPLRVPIQDCDQTLVVTGQLRHHRDRHTHTKITRRLANLQIGHLDIEILPAVRLQSGLSKQTFVSSFRVHRWGNCGDCHRAAHRCRAHAADNTGDYFTCYNHSTHSPAVVTFTFHRNHNSDVFTLEGLQTECHYVATTLHPSRARIKLCIVIKGRHLVFGINQKMRKTVCFIAICDNGERKTTIEGCNFIQSEIFIFMATICFHVLFRTISKHMSQSNMN